MKKLLYTLAALIMLFTACQKDEETTIPTSNSSLSGLKNGVFTVDNKEVRPNQLFFSGGNLEARISGTTTLNDIIVEIGNNPETKTYTLSNKTITATVLRIEYQTGTISNPIYWHSKSGTISIVKNSNSVTADFKDVVFENTADATQTVKISANITGAIQ